MYGSFWKVVTMHFAWIQLINKVVTLDNLHRRWVEYEVKHVSRALLMMNLQPIYCSPMRSLRTYGKCVILGRGLFMYTITRQMYTFTSLNILQLVIKETVYEGSSGWL